MKKGIVTENINSNIGKGIPAGTSMKKCNKTNYAFIGLLTLLIMLFANSVHGLEVLIWDNDLGATIDDPEGAGTVGCEYAIQQALTANGISYTTLTDMPLDLSPYDLVFITLGHWHVGC